MKIKYRLVAEDADLILVSKTAYLKRKAVQFEQAVTHGSVRVVYLDNEPVVSAWGKVILDGYPYFDGGCKIEKSLIFSEKISSRDRRVVELWSAEGKPDFMLKGFFPGESTVEISGRYKLEKLSEYTLSIDAEEIHFAEREISIKDAGTFRASGIPYEAFELMLQSPYETGMVFSKELTISVDGKTIEKSRSFIKRAIDAAINSLADEPVAKLPTVQKVVVVNRLGSSEFTVNCYGEFNPKLLTASAKRIKLPGDRHLTTLFELKYDGRAFQFADGSASEACAYVVDDRGRSTMIDVYENDCDEDYD